MKVTLQKVGPLRTLYYTHRIEQALRVGEEAVPLASAVNRALIRVVGVASDVTRGQDGEWGRWQTSRHTCCAIRRKS